MEHSLFLNDLLVKIYTIEKDTITIGMAVLVVIVGIFYYKLLHKSF